METLPSLSIGYYSIWYRALLENMIIHDVNLAWWSGPFDSDPDEKRMQKKIEELTKHRIAYFISIFFSILKNMSSSSSSKALASPE